MNYKNQVPSESFIGKYMEYMEAVETASAYDFWCAVWAIGVGIGRGTYIDRPHSPVFLNWYVILAAESGTTRKSTAVRTISNLVRDVGEHRLFTGRVTPLDLTREIALRSNNTGAGSVSLSFTELINILGREGYMRPMPGLLTDLYDCPEEQYGERNTDDAYPKLSNVYLNLLSASTPTWLATDINPSVIEGGFTSRVIFVVEERPKKLIPWPEEKSDEQWDHLLHLYKRTCGDARAINSLRISPKALQSFSRWYRKRDNHHDPYLKSFEAREDDFVLKLAGTLSINDGTLELQTRHVTKAINIVTECKHRAFSIFGGSGTEMGRYSGAINKLRRELVTCGMDGVSHTDLYYKVRKRVDRKDYNLLLKILHEAKLIQVFESSTGGRFYRATQALNGPGVTTKVLQTLNVID